MNLLHLLPDNKWHRKRRRHTGVRPRPSRRGGSPRRKTTRRRYRSITRTRSITWRLVANGSVNTQKAGQWMWPGTLWRICRGKGYNRKRTANAVLFVGVEEKIWANCKLLFPVSCAYFRFVIQYVRAENHRRSRDLYILLSALRCSVKRRLPCHPARAELRQMYGPRGKFFLKGGLIHGHISVLSGSLHSSWCSCWYDIACPVYHGQKKVSRLLQQRLTCFELQNSKHI